MDRVANAVEALAVTLLLGLLTGALDGLFADPVAAESVAQRMGTFALLDAVVLLPVGLLASLVAMGASRRARKRRAFLPLGLVAAFGYGLSHVVQSTSTSEELRGSWLLEQPLPYLRSPDEVRSVALITVDTMRYDALEHMPRLRQRAESARRYDNAHSTSSWTLPAMASLHTGLAPADHGAGARMGPSSHQRSGLRDEVGTLAEALRLRGYVTGAVVTNPYLSVRYGLHRGFDRYIDLSRRALLQRGLRRSLLWRPWVPAATDDPVPRALQLHSRMVEGRAFLWVHAIEPHAPYTRLDTDPHEDCAMPDCFSDWRTRGDMDTIRALYDADLARLDQQLDPLLEELIAPNRLVVLVADHGEAFGEHDGQAHGHAFYDEVTRVPLLVWGDGQGVVDHNVDLMGLHQALLSWADGGEATVVETQTPMAGLLFGEESSACVDGRHKYIDGVGAFDLRADPLELTVLQQPAPCALRPIPPAEGDAQDVGVLRSLGYVE